MKYNLIGVYKYKDLERFTYAQLESDEVAKRRQYIILYEPNEVTFDHLGQGVLNDCIINPIIVKEINGDYSFTATIVKDQRGKYKRIKPLSVIKAQGQLFRIPLWTGIKENDHTVEISAQHIMWDLNNCFTEDRRVNGQNVHETMSRLLESDYTGRFQIGVTDVTATATANFIDETILDSIMKKVVPRWRAEIAVDNFTITPKNRLGAYKPNLFIRYGKNASKMKYTIDCGDLCTRIYAKGKEGIDLKPINNNLRYLESSKVNNYPLLYPKLVKFEEAETPEELLVAARKYLSDNDTPKDHLELELIDLLDNSEYENLKNSLQINLGDTVTVYDKDLGVNKELRCIREEILADTGVKVKIELGQFKPSMATSVTDIEEKTDQIETRVESSINSTDDLKEQVVSNTVDIINLVSEVDNLNKDITATNSDIGQLAALETEYKKDIVGAINEVNIKSGQSGSRVLPIVDSINPATPNDYAAIVRNNGNPYLATKLNDKWFKVDFIEFTPD